MTLLGFFLLSSGVMLLVFTSAYVKDIETLRRLPNEIWNAICGRPSDAGAVLPLLLTFASLTLFGGAGILAWQRFSAWRGQHRAA
jgi:hypothetical protein